jgi:hypothetical protein
MRKHCRQLDAGVGASGPHDFAVRPNLLVAQRQGVHRIPHPTSVTIAKRPSRGGGTKPQYACFYPAVKLISENPKLVPLASNPAIAGTAATL